MALRLWYQSMSDLEQYPEYRQALTTHARDVVQPTTSVDVFGVRPGTYGAFAPVEVLQYPYAYHIMLEQIIGNCVRAEQAGYDGVVLGSFSEPFLRQCRAAVDISVASMAESTLLVACSVAAKIGLVTLNEEIAWMTEKHVGEHRLEGRLASVKVLADRVTERELVSSFSSPDKMVGLFLDAARAAIADRADVIIPAEGVLNEVVVANGVREVDGVSVMDAVGVNLMYGEMLAKLRAVTGLRAGRRWEYPLAPPAVRTLLREHALVEPLSAATID